MSCTDFVPEVLNHAGFFDEEDIDHQKFRLVEGKAGSLETGNSVVLYWSVAFDNGIINDAKFQAFGDPSLICKANEVCEKVIGNDYDMALRMYNDTECVVCQAVSEASKQCRDIPIEAPYVKSLMSEVDQQQGEGYPGWEDLPFAKKMAVIESVLDADVRPYIQMDGGNVEVVDFVDDKRLIIAYQGACATCFSALGSTLSYIQHIISSKVSSDIIVEPSFDQDSFFAEPQF